MGIDADTYIWELMETCPGSEEVLAWYGVEELGPLVRLTLGALCRLYDLDVDAVASTLQAAASAALSSAARARGAGPAARWLGPEDLPARRGAPFAPEKTITAPYPV